MDDRSTTIAALREKLGAFRDARNWKQFHKPKDLAVALGIELGELQELFLWKTHEQIDAYLATEDGRAKLKEEIADVFIFCLFLADATGVDLADAAAYKMDLNEKKYPVDKSFNSPKKYTEL